MANSPGHADDQAALIALYLKGMIEKIFDPVAQQMHEYWHQFAPESGSSGHAGVNPNTIGRAARILRGRESLTMGELSAELSVPLSTTTRMVDWLVAKGQAVRLPDSDDRRIVRVALTEAGLKMHDFIEEQLSQNVRRTLECLSEDERSALLAVLRKLASSKGDSPDTATSSIRPRMEKES